jgi:uncharacterized protein (DUF362 family)
MGLDTEHYGSSRWNPLGQYIKPGQTVLIKPNLVLDHSKKKGEDFYSVVTHPEIIRCMTDLVYVALEGRGRILIGDAPLLNARFDILCESLGLNQLKEFYALKDFSLDVVDFRLSTVEKNEQGILKNKKTFSDPDNYRIINLGNASLLSEYDIHFNDFRVTEYNSSEMARHHRPDTHEYCIHRSVFDADVILSLPKIKTHRKAGFTCAMKNLIGINGSKDWLPHHRKGSREEGGDEYLHKSRRKKLISRLWDIRWKQTNPFIQYLLLACERMIQHTSRFFPFKDPYFEGSWWGNTTISRTINDLNRIAIYSDKNGILRDTPQRTMLYMVDGIICGEGEGPMEATGKKCDMLIWSENAVASDMVTATLMGFDFKKIDTLRLPSQTRTYKIFGREFSDILVRTNLANHPYSLDKIRTLLKFHFKPSSGWEGYIELEENI